MNFFKILFVFLIFSVEVFSQNKEKINIKAKVTAVKDGDTIEVLYYEFPIKVRLSNIDAPEVRGGQPYGKASRKVLSFKCLNKEIIIKSDGKYDQNGRLIAEIFSLENQNINKAMVKEGYAWHFVKYSDDFSYAVLQNEAKSQKRGLWAEPNPISPWDFRKKK